MVFPRILWDLDDFREVAGRDERWRLSSGRAHAVREEGHCKAKLKIFRNGRQDEVAAIFLLETLN